MTPNDRYEKLREYVSDGPQECRSCEHLALDLCAECGYCTDNQCCEHERERAVQEFDDAIERLRELSRLKQCYNCGHIGTDVSDHLHSNESGLYYLTQCDNIPACWSRRDADANPS